MELMFIRSAEAAGAKFWSRIDGLTGSIFSEGQHRLDILHLSILIYWSAWLEFFPLKLCYFGYCLSSNWIVWITEEFISCTAIGSVRVLRVC
uniref:Uncharacterized protein n=1 Tax=Arundo donax TaxID=35708 RepID=A0A0A8YDM4_ARUDO